MASSVEKPSLLAELKRRRVYRAAAVYAGIAAAVLGLAGTVLPAFHAPDCILQGLIIVAAAGFPFAAMGAWVFDIKGFRLKRTPEIPGSEKLNPGRLLIVALAAGVSAAAIFLLWSWVSNRETIFDSNTVGVIVLSISGDDASHSLQRDLVSSLNTALATRPEMSNVKVRASRVEVSEADGLDNANEQVLTVGRRTNATLVLWGEKIQEQKFHPRLTVIAAFPAVTEMATHGLTPQILTAGLPEQFAYRPIALLDLIEGLRCFLKEDYKNATIHYDAVLAGAGMAHEEMPDIQTLGAYAYLLRAMGGDDRAKCLDRAIELFERAANSPRQECPEAANRWFWVARSYQCKTTGKSVETDQRALTAANKAIELALQCNDRVTRFRAILERGKIYSNGNIQGPLTAVTELEASIHELNQTQLFPEKNELLSDTHFALATSLVRIEPVEKSNLDKAMSAAAEWRRIQSGRGGPHEDAAWEELMASIHLKCMQTPDDPDGQAALAAFIKLKRLALELDSSEYYSSACCGLGSFYLNAFKNDKNLDDAIVEFEECLQKRDSDEYPEEWAETKINLAAAHVKHEKDLRVHEATAIQILNDVVKNQSEAIPDRLRAVAHFNLGLTLLNSADKETPDSLKAVTEHLEWALRHCEKDYKELCRSYLNETRRRLRALRR